MTSMIASSPDQICPALTGTRMAGVRLTTADGNPLDLNASVAKQRAVVVFYRGGW